MLSGPEKGVRTSLRYPDLRSLATHQASEDTQILGDRRLSSLSRFSKRGEGVMTHLLLQVANSQGTSCQCEQSSLHGHLDAGIHKSSSPTSSGCGMVHGAWCMVHGAWCWCELKGAPHQPSGPFHVHHYTSSTVWLRTQAGQSASSNGTCA